MTAAVAAVATRGSPVKTTVRPLIVGCLLALSVIAVPQANAATDADWAWPGMQYDKYKGNSWSSCSVGFPAWNSAGTRCFISAGDCFRDPAGTQYLHPDGSWGRPLHSVGPFHPNRL
jgi:hypothetical protein